MQQKVYRAAALALLALAINSTTFAQHPAQSVKPAAPVPPVAASPATSINGVLVPAMPLNGLSYSLAPLKGIDYNSFDLAPLSYNGLDYALNFGPQDTTYQKKMRQLQSQLRDLQKEMSSLRSEELRKNSEELRKNSAELQKQFNGLRFNDLRDNSKYSTELNRLFADKFKGFDQKFQNFNQNFNFNFNFDKADPDFDKKVQSGEIKLKSKTYSKSYTVDKDDKLDIKNRYGKVTINTWNKNEIKVDVDIKAYADNDDDAQKLLDQVKINDSKGSEGVSFNTVLGDEDHQNNFWGTMTRNGKTTVRRTVVNYTVYMPQKNALTIANSFGAIVLPELSGKLNIKNSYGSLTSKALTFPGNTIDVKYGAANIESLINSDLNVAYGSLNLAAADKLNANIKFSPAKIGKISTSGIINLHYGQGLEIGNLDKNLKNLQVTSSFAPVQLSSLDNDNANFDVTVHNGGFSYNNGVSVTSKIPDNNRGWSSTQNYKGRIGKGDNDKVITIKSNYSSVKFDQ